LWPGAASVILGSSGPLTVVTHTANPLVVSLPRISRRTSRPM
jgi:hypothetical protein